MLVMFLALLYKSIFSMNEIGYLFWFYSGVVASRVLEERRAEKRGRAGTRASRFGWSGQMPGLEERGIGWRS